jgi:hypothetical protein
MEMVNVLGVEATFVERVHRPNEAGNGCGEGGIGGRGDFYDG